MAHCQFVHHKSRMNFSEIEAGSRSKQFDRLRHGTAIYRINCVKYNAETFFILTECIKYKIRSTDVMMLILGINAYHSMVSILVIQSQHQDITLK